MPVEEHIAHKAAGPGAPAQVPLPPRASIGRPRAPRIGPGARARPCSPPPPPPLPPGPGARGALIRPRTSLTAPLPLWTSTSERARRLHPEHWATRYDRRSLPTYDIYSDTWTDRLWTCDSFYITLQIYGFIVECLWYSARCSLKILKRLVRWCRRSMRTVRWRSDRCSFGRSDQRRRPLHRLTPPTWPPDSIMIITVSTSL